MVNIKDVKKQLEILNKLLNAAGNEAVRYGEQRGWDCDYDSEDEDYLEYKKECFDKVWLPFWKIANQLGISRDEYYENNDTYEQAMKKALYDYEQSNPDWLLDVLEEVDED